MSLSRGSRQYLGVRAILPPDLQLALRAPTSSDKAYVKGTLWLDTLATTAYMWPGTGNWIALGSGTVGAIVTLTGDSGGAISPVAGNIDILGGSGVSVVGTAGTLTISLTGGGVAMDSFVPDAGTNPVVPTALGAVTMAGTANQITTTGGLNTLTFSIPAVFIAPGSIEATTTALIGTGLTVTTGGILVSGGDIINSHSDAATDVTIEVTNSDNTSGTSRAGVEIATGGASSGDPYLSFQISGVGASTMTLGLDNSASDLFVISTSATVGTSNALTLTQAGALSATTSVTAGNGITATLGDIVASAGNISATLGSLSGATTVTAGTGITSTTGNIVATAGAVNAGTSMTATLGNITATNGNLVLGTAGNKIVSTSVASTTTAGANSFGTVTLSGGTATISTSSVTASSIIILTRQSVGATGAAALGELSVGTIVASTSFIINAWSQADATALAATDVSSIGWVIIN